MTKRYLSKRKLTEKQAEKVIKESRRQFQFEESIRDEITNRLFDLKTNYSIRPGSDPFTTFKLYVDITRGIKI